MQIRKAFRLSAPALVAALAGCTSAQVQTAEASLRTVATSTVGVLTLAEAHPELLAEAKAAVSTLATKVSTPDHAAAVELALAHVTAGNVSEAKAIVALVANQIPGPGAVTQ